VRQIAAAVSPGGAPASPFLVFDDMLPPVDDMLLVKTHGSVGWRGNLGDLRLGS
jgi:hypothetical protein